MLDDAVCLGGLWLMGIGFLMCYVITWLLLFFGVLANLSDKDWGLAYVFLSALVVWTGFAVCFIAWVI